MNSQRTVVIIAIPPTTPTTVVFPSSADGRRFDSGFYNPGLTDGRASFEEINQFLAEIDAVRNGFRSQEGAGTCFRVLGFLLIMLLFMGGMVVLTLNNPTLVPVGVVGFIILVVCLGWITTKRLKKVRTEFQAKCQEIVNKHNQNLAARGLRWHLPVYFPRWVELWKDYNQGQGFVGQPIYMPPVNQQPYGAVQNYQGQMNNNVYTPPSQF